MLLAVSATLSACSPNQQSSSNEPQKLEVMDFPDENSDVNAPTLDLTQIMQNELNYIKTAVELGENFNEYDQFGKTPLFNHVKMNNVAAVELLLQNGANPNLAQIRKENFASTVDFYMKTHNLTREQLPDNIRYSGENNGETPVFSAYTLEMIKLLEKYGADINRKNIHGKQVLAAFDGNPNDGYPDSRNWNTELASYLVEKGNSIDNLKNFVPDNAERTQFCIDHGLKFNMQEKLLQSIRFNSPKSLDILIKNGGREFVNRSYNSSGHISSPLFDAVEKTANLSGIERQKGKKIIELLVLNGANIKKEVEGQSPLDLADFYEDKDLTKFLKNCAKLATDKSFALKSELSR